MPFKRLLPMSAGLCLLLVTACEDEVPTPAAPEVVTETTLQVQPGQTMRVLVQLPSEAARAAVAAEARGMGATVLRQYNNFPLLALEVNDNALRGLQRSPRVVSITEDVAVPPALDSSLPVINADVVQSLGFDGSGVAVAIIDSGIDGDHPFFGGRVVEEACFSTNDSNRTSLCPGTAPTLFGTGSASIDVPACNDGGVNICDHGTHVAGIAAGDGAGLTGAPDAGVAPDADIIAIQVFHRLDDFTGCLPQITPCIRTFSADYIAGLDRVLDLINDHTIAAVNLSLGGGEHMGSCDLSPVKIFVDLLLSVDIATVIAAGNDGFDAAVAHPACVSTAVTVGATDDSDAVADFSNRGLLLDVFAPGVDITSSAENGGYETKGGTSMATPHVTGALAVLRQVFPNAPAGQLIDLVKTSGPSIAYTSAGIPVNTRRLDLLATLRLDPTPPQLAVDEETVTVDEGQTATNTGTYISAGLTAMSASTGNVVDEGGGVWSWSAFGGASDGPSQQSITITGTDAFGQQDAVTFDVVVNNVAPRVVIDAEQVTTADENTELLVKAGFEDPGLFDTHHVVVTCHTVGGAVTAPPSIGITKNTVIEGTVTATCPYGDDSDPTFGVAVSVTDDDGGEGVATFDLTVNNVSPSVSLDERPATVVNGVPTFLAQLGEPLSFRGHVTDPGSDDLALGWDWGDRSFDQAIYLVDGPGPDLLPSPGVDPRDVTDGQTHTWTSACVFTLILTATDDDGGTGSDEGAVLIAGASRMARGQGYWASQYRGRSAHFDAATLDCYLEIAGHMSMVFSEERDASTGAKAAEVLRVPGSRGDISQLLDQELLAAWLNFANGAYLFDELVDTTGDQVPDTPFSDAVAEAEAVRLDPRSTASELEEQKDVLEAINLRDGG